MKRIRELNETFFELYARLGENGEDLTKRQRDAMCVRLLKQYEIEYQKIVLEKEIEDKKELFNVRLLKGYFAPFSFLFIRNKIAKLMSLEVEKQASEYFNKYNNKLNQNNEKGKKNVKKN